jgi:hypothetical protein
MATIGDIIENAQTPGGVSGTLALGIMGTPCWVYIRDPSANAEIGKTLTYAFISIVGFYFGTTATKGAPAPGAPPVPAPAVPAPAVALPAPALAQPAGGAVPAGGAQ